MSVYRKGEPTNDTRSKWAAVALNAFQEVVGTDYEDALCDLLCDLMHWADANDHDFDAELVRATGHFEVERCGTLEKGKSMKIFNVHVRLAEQIEAENEDEAFDKMLEALDQRDGFEIMGHDIMEEKNGVGVRKYLGAET